MFRVPEVLVRSVPGLHHPGGRLEEGAGGGPDPGAGRGGARPGPRGCRYLQVRIGMVAWFFFCPIICVIKNSLSVLQKTVEKNELV